MEDREEFDDLFLTRGGSFLKQRRRSPLDYPNSGMKRFSDAGAGVISRQTRRDVINGLFHKLDAAPRLPTEQVRQVRLFLASAGKDTEIERTMLVDRMVPELRTFCRERGLDFQLVDLRWGIPEENLGDVLTTDLCYEELARCQRLSVGPCYFLFLSDRLSDRSLPDRVSLPLFDHACAALFQRKLDPNRLIRWYKMDKNILPPDYVLKKEELLTSPTNTKGEATHEVLELLEKSLSIVYKKDRVGDMKLKLLGSGLEWVTYGELLNEHAERQRAICVIRDFTQINMADDAARVHTDMRVVQGKMAPDTELGGILKTMKEDIISEDGEIMMDTAFHATLPWSIKGVDLENNAHAQYLQSMVAGVIQQTRRCILRALKRHMTHSLASDWLLEEVLNHVTYARQVHHCIRVRNDIIERVLMYIGDNEDKSGRPFIVHGDAGSGKTLILGKVATSAATSGEDGCMVAVRFAGTTARSQTLLDILRSLILQIAEGFGVHHTIGSHSYGTSAMGYCFRKLLERITQNETLRKRTLVIIIDAIELLLPETDDIEDFTDLLSWLPDQLPPSIKVVFSTRWSEETLATRFKDRASNRKYSVVVDQLGEKVAEDTFDSWVQVEGRQLTRVQKEAIRGAFRSGSHPLLLRLVFSETRLWDSFSNPSDQDNGKKFSMEFHGVEAACNTFFERLEKKYGQQLVSRTLGYLLAARDGLTECELIDVLSADDHVMSAVYVTWTPPSERVVRLPHPLWGRLRLRLHEHLVTCVSGGSLVLKLRRSILYDVACRRYLSPEAATSLHSSLADYFLGTYHDKSKPLRVGGPTAKVRTIHADRKQPAQPLRFGQPSGHVNFRKLTELPYQLHHAGRHDDLITSCLGNYDWVSTVAATCCIDDILRDLSMTLTTSTSPWAPVPSSVILVKSPTSSTSSTSSSMKAQTPSVIDEKLRHQLELVKETLELVQVSVESGRPENPLAVDIIGRLVALADRYPEVIGKLVRGAQQYCANPRRSLMMPLRPCFPSPSGAAVERLVGHQGGATHLDLSPDGSTLVSGGSDGGVKVWAGGRVLRSLQLTDEVRHVCLMADQKRVVILAGSRIHFMDLYTGKLLHVIKVPEIPDAANTQSPAKNIELLLCKREVMTHFAASKWMALRVGSVVFVLDVTRMELVHQLEGHDDTVTCVAMSEAGHHLVSGSMDRSVRVWHTDLGQELHVIKQHVSHVTDVAVAPTHEFVSVSLDGTIVIAHLLTGNVLRKLTWPGHALFSVAISGSGSRIAVGSFGEIGLWDSSKGCLVGTVAGHRQNISRIAYVAARNQQNWKKQFEYLMSMSTNGELKIWNIEDDNLTHSASGMVGKDATVKVANNKAVMGSRDSPFLKVWSLNFDPESTTAPLEGGIYDPIAVSADGQYVVTVHSNCTDLVLYDVSRGVELHKLPAHKTKITCLCMLSDNQHVLSGAADGVVKMWYRNGETLEEVHSMAFEKEIVCLAPHPKNKMAVICHKDNIVRMRHMNNKNVDEAHIHVQDSNITVVAVGEDQIIYGTDQGKVYVWTYENHANPVMMLQGHTGAVSHLTIREKYLASIGEKEQNAIIWNCQTGKRLGDLPTGEDTVTSITWSSDMHHLIIGFDTSLVHIYDVIAQTKLTSLDVYSPVSVIVAQSDIISISTTGGYFGVYKLVVSENFDPSVYSDSLETRYSVSSLQASRPALQQGPGDRRKSSTCSIL